MIQERRQVKNYKQMMDAYEDSCLKISNRYCSEMSKLTQDSISTLCHLFRSYLLNKKTIFDHCQSTQVKSTLDSSHKPIRAGAKHIYQEDSLFYLPASVVKSKQNKNNQNLILSNPIQKISLGSELLLEDSDQDNQPAFKITNFADLKNKNLAQIIRQSQRKVQDQQMQMKNAQIISDSQSNYEITDYSSNQSSNQGSYTAYYIENEDNSNKPLFNGLFTKTLSSESINSNSSNLLNFNFSSKQLQKSPKKLTKSKRLFVGSKKVPRWAQDLAEIERKCDKQDTNATSIFGKCVVQKLNTNVIFHWKKEGIKRTSSAKWCSQMFIT